MTYAAALEIERWPTGGARVLIPRTRLEVEAGMRPEDSWFVARERPAGWVEPDYGGGDRVEDQQTLGKGPEADRGGTYRVMTESRLACGTTCAGSGSTWRTWRGT